MAELQVYDDLIQLDVEKYQERINSLETHVNTLNEDVQRLCAKIMEMKELQQSLVRNISALYATAKTEIERKDRMIAQLRKEKDDLLFKKGEFKPYFNGSKRPRSRSRSNGRENRNLKAEHDHKNNIDMSRYKERETEDTHGKENRRCPPRKPNNRRDYHTNIVHTPRSSRDRDRRDSDSKSRSSANRDPKDETTTMDLRNKFRRDSNEKSEENQQVKKEKDAYSTKHEQSCSNKLKDNLPSQNSTNKNHSNRKLEPENFNMRKKSGSERSKSIALRRSPTKHESSPKYESSSKRRKIGPEMNIISGDEKKSLILQRNTVVKPAELVKIENPVRKVKLDKIEPNAANALLTILDEENHSVNQIGFEDKPLVNINNVNGRNTISVKNESYTAAIKKQMQISSGQNIMNTKYDRNNTVDIVPLEEGEIPDDEEQQEELFNPTLDCNITVPPENEKPENEKETNIVVTNECSAKMEVADECSTAGIQDVQNTKSVDVLNLSEVADESSTAAIQDVQNTKSVDVLNLSEVADESSTAAIQDVQNTKSVDVLNSSEVADECSTAAIQDVQNTKSVDVLNSSTSSNNSTLYSSRRRRRAIVFVT